MDRLTDVRHGFQWTDVHRMWKFRVVRQEEKRKNTQAWCDKRGCDGWMEADHFNFLIIRLPVIVFDDTEAIY